MSAMWRSLSVPWNFSPSCWPPGWRSASTSVTKSAVRKRLLEEVDRAHAGGAFPLRGEMDRRQDDRARVRMAGAQIVEEFLPEIVGRIDVENEEIGLLVDDDMLRFFQAVRDIDMRGRRRFVKRGADRGGEVVVRREDQNATARLSRNGIRRGPFDSKQCKAWTKQPTRRTASRVALRHARFSRNEKYFSRTPTELRGRRSSREPVTGAAVNRYCTSC